jgi:transcriptional regulator GlxA family with amidase domain
MLEEQAREASTPQPLPALPLIHAVRSTRLRRAMLIIDDPSPRPPVAALAGAVGPSARQLNRLFRSEAGQTPISFRDTLRIARADALLLRSDLQMTDIALRCGFADAAHFSRRYKLRTGRTVSGSLPPIAFGRGRCTLRRC